MAVDAVSNGFGVNMNITPSSSKVENKAPKESVKVEEQVNLPSAKAPETYQPASSEPSKTESKNETRKEEKIALSEENNYFKKVQKEEEDRKKRTKEEEQEKEREDETRKEAMQKLTEELNKKVNQFSSSIKFGFNDKTNSVAVTMMDGNKETSVKQISPQEANKLADRMSYVLGILFDQKA